MGSGFNFFTDAINKSLTVTGSWQDVDCSADIPAGSSGIILKIVNTSNVERGVKIRKNGSTEDISQDIQVNHTIYAFCAVDENRIFEGYISADVVDFYLIGYTDDAVVFFNPTVDKTPATAGSWQDIDLSGNIPAEAVGVIMMLRNVTTYASHYLGVRKNGSTDVFPYGILGTGSKGSHIYQLCGVDANRFIEGKVNNTTYAKIHLIAYVKSPIVFFTNGVAKSLTPTGSWEDVDITSDATADTDGAILFVKNQSATTIYQGDVRKNGSIDDHYTNSKLSSSAGGGESRGCAIGVDVDQIFEGKIEHTDMDFYLIGYCKPSAAPPVSAAGILVQVM